MINICVVQARTSEPPNAAGRPGLPRCHRSASCAQISPCFKPAQRNLTIQLVAPGHPEATRLLSLTCIALSKPRHQRATSMQSWTIRSFCMNNAVARPSISTFALCYKIHASASGEHLVVCLRYAQKDVSESSRSLHLAPAEVASSVSALCLSGLSASSCSTAARGSQRHASTFSSLRADRRPTPFDCLPRLRCSLATRLALGVQRGRARQSAQH